MSSRPITRQAAGAFGESSITAELLRQGWMPANVNATVKNAADFDIYAWKERRAIQLRVKACGPNICEFQFGGFSPSESIKVEAIGDLDFTILVSMGDERKKDQFYIVPTRIVRDEITLRRKSWLKISKRDGGQRKDIGMWVLRLADRKDGQQEAGWGLARKWKRYLEAWELLDGK